MKGGKCVSVFIPMYNAEEVVIRAIESARAQNIPASRDHRVDDGSTDDSRLW
jgi:glycosyltransferase involved in cell wall biosynthesis